MTKEIPEEHALYEIIELEEGEVGLCRAGEDGPEGEPLVAIRFSEESRYFLGQACGHIAKIMIEAGLDAVHDIQEAVREERGDVELETHLIH